VTGFMWAALALIGGLGMTALGDMVSEEVRDRLDHLPHAILQLAASRLDPELRVRYYEEDWLPDLAFLLKGDEARPVTRLIHGTSFALGILMSADRIGGAHQENGRLIAAVEQGMTGPEVLARKILARADPARPGRWRLSAGGLLIVSVDRLSTARAADLAACMASDGRQDVALWWIQAWLRPERTCRRRSDDVAAIYRRLREWWEGDLAELRDAFLRATDHYSMDSRQEVEQKLNEQSPEEDEQSPVRHPRA
jgi:hypothetical protein